MTENKRFQYNVNKNSIEQNGKHFAYCNGEQTKIVKKLNELYGENEELRADNNRLVNETAKVVAEHQRKVFELIDEQINEYIYKEKLYKHKGKGREASVFNLYCFCLNNLKKELSE